MNWPFAPLAPPPSLPLCAHGISAADWCPACLDDFVIDHGVPATPEPLKCTCGYGKEWDNRYHSDWCDYKKGTP
jgi:hypothetical protein